ncbi:MAG: GNAT family N-acetyltransferase [Acidobacteria bacterium]|nr:MAG: GNAT family N-acetyltransferase [Acidobacteriota bacterium]REK05862.1 MAG: GNAT family N-acetyltransferase [Acidobacteriota bacterium]
MPDKNEKKTKGTEAGERAAGGAAGRRRSGDDGSATRAGAERESKITVRRAKLEDVDALYECQRKVYGSRTGTALCTPRELELQVRTFPEGQLIAVDGNEIVGYATSLIVLLDEDSPWYSYSEITGAATFSTHDPAGDTLYGADIGVLPERRGQRIAQKLYAARKRLLKRYNLRRMVAGGRIPGYAEHAGKMTAEEYVDKVVAGELRDSSLNAHLRAGYVVRSVHMGYLRDEQSLDYATFLELANPDFREPKRRIAAAPMKRPVRKVRVCAAQYLMRNIKTWAEFEHQVDFFVSTAEEYHCHFLLFPELFTAQLFSTLPKGLTDAEAIRELAALEQRYQKMFIDRARETGLFIVGGSHPCVVDDQIRNVAFLFTPTGKVHRQDKLHPTPFERAEYGIRGGEGLTVFETPFARIAIQICYDVEFPEVTRLLTLAGAEILFVPFSTDTRKAYQRVRHSAQARCVENYIYAVLAGNAGNLPQVDNFLINYSLSVVCTPCDMGFPEDGVAGVAEANSETVVICDLDLSSLEVNRATGSVRPLRDRRTDLFKLEPVTPVRYVKAR